MTTTLIFLKLGGSLITDKNRSDTARLEVIRRCAQEVAQALSADPGLRLVLAHGSGSFGHFAALHSGFGRGVQGYAETGAAAARLNRLVADSCLAEGLPVVSMPPSASAICDGGRLVTLAMRPVEIALAGGLIPLLYGDVAFDLSRGATIISTEMLFAHLAPVLRPARIVLAGLVDGVHTADPTLDPGARRIGHITPRAFPEIAAALGASSAVDVTGGMFDKVKVMVDLVNSLPGLRVQILSGTTPGTLVHAMRHEESSRGTWIDGGASRS